MTRAAIAAFTLCLFGCVAPKPKPAAPVAPAVRKVTQEQRTANQQKFFKAVDAYMGGDYVGCRRLIDEILRVDPTDKEALGLRARVEAVQKAGSR